MIRSGELKTTMDHGWACACESIRVPKKFGWLSGENNSVIVEWDEGGALSVAFFIESFDKLDFSWAFYYTDIPLASPGYEKRYLTLIKKYTDHWYVIGPNPGLWRSAFELLDIVDMGHGSNVG